jgi:hypothetical protein
MWLASEQGHSKQRREEEYSSRSGRDFRMYPHKEKQGEW